MMVSKKIKLAEFNNLFFSIFVLFRKSWAKFVAVVIKKKKVLYSARSKNGEMKLQ